MKRFIYSTYTKFVALVLVICTVAFAANVVLDTIYTYTNEYQLYGFEESFEKSRYLEAALSDPSGAVDNAYAQYYHSEDKTGMSVEENLKTALEHIDSSKIKYFISLNGTVFTNCGAQSEDDITKDKYYALDVRYADGRQEYDTIYGYNYSPLQDMEEYNSEDEIIVAASVDEAFAEECETLWNRQEEYIRDAFIKAVILCIAALLVLIYLIAVCGKAYTGEHKKMWLDSIWTEVHLTNIILSGGLVIGAWFIVFEMYFYNQMPLYMVKAIVIFALCAGCLLIITSLLSIVRKIKCGMFLKSSIIRKIFIWTWSILVKVIESVRGAIVHIRSILKSAVNRKSTAILTGLLFVYTALIGLCGIFTLETGAGLMAGIALFIFATFLLIYRAKDIDSIREGANEIRNGNLTYKINDIKSEDLKALAEDINEIGMGLDESVAAKMKAERLKTELITNVSHDLKTPLTSIISYTELLSKVENLPEEAKDYIRIIEKKSQRLKNLTQDLFDISKVQSGNEVINSERLDIALLINQSLGEHDGEIKNSNLTFCVNVSKELFVLADGRKMSRVISNLINNALKYSMKNTRVFVSAYEEDAQVIIELKNVASYAMEFDADEIMGRFVRGDEARTTEGSGLGLAIAKSYTEASGGKFNVVVDGDLFKAIIKFNKA